MKRILTITAAVLFISSGWINSQTPTTANGSQENSAISSIRQRYATINRNLSKYKKVKKELAGFSTEGGELVAYFDGSSIVKIAATYYGESGRALEEFYYSNEKLVFVFRKDDTYDKPMSGKVARTAEDRFYFNNDEMIRWVNGRSKQVQPSNGEYATKREQYLRLSKLFVAGARSNESTIEAPARGE